MSSDEPFQENRESYRDKRYAIYNEHYLEPEKKWKKLDVDGVLYYDLKALMSLAACPLYASSNNDLSFELQSLVCDPSWPAPQVFGLLYEHQPPQVWQVAYVQTRHVGWLDYSELEQYVGPSSVNLLHYEVASLVNESRRAKTIPQKVWGLMREFSEAYLSKHGGPLPENVEETFLTKMIQVGAGSMAQHQATALNWTFLQLDEPILLGVAYTVIGHPSQAAHIVSVSALNASRAELLDLLDSVQPLGGKDEALLRRTEDGLNHMERRQYREIARHFKAS